ncbi:MAG: DNA polymerase III subunit beta [Gammaproteobacteria bacterium]|nr:DNA polymerase III subunit beta [Gammaproteobacteria bacterium]
MQFSVGRRELLSKLQMVTNVVERRQTLPILGNVKLSWADNSLALTGTDLDLEVDTKVSIDSDAQGATTVPARKFLDLCKAAPEDAELRFEQQESRFLVRYGKSRFSLGTLPADEFPMVETSGDALEFDIPQKVLRRLFEKTQFAMAQQDVRYYLNGLLLELSGDAVRTVATDGHRMAISESPVGISGTETRSAILARKSVLELGKLMGGGDRSAHLKLYKTHLVAEADDAKIATRLVDGSFPDYERVIPSKTDRLAKINRQGFREALQRVAILSSEKYRAVRLEFYGSELKLSARNPDQEEAEELLEIEYQGEPLEIGFNVNYLLDVLSAVEADTVEMQLADSSSSCLIAQPGETSERYVVMPLRL